MLKQFFSRFIKLKETDPEKAYDLWAAHYDDQPGNLMLALDEEIFTVLLNDAGANNKRVLDIGCGTGRHWQQILAQHPIALEGYDVSKKMLKMLTHKFPQALTHQLSGNHLTVSADSSVDLLITTLTIAHIEDAAAALKEWDRVVRPGGDIIITDYHPGILQKGGKRTFKNDNTIIAVKNYIHSVNELKIIAQGMGWNLRTYIEKKIDNTMKPYYEKQHALSVFETFRGMPVIYGLHFKKQ